MSDPSTETFFCIRAHNRVGQRELTAYMWFIKKRKLPLVYQIGIHTPKTAGTSLRRALAWTKLRRQVSYVYEEKPGIPRDTFVKEFHQKHAQKRLILGHIHFGFHLALGVEARYFTVLREPVARALSLYRHLVREPQSIFYRKIDCNSQRSFHTIASESGLCGLFNYDGKGAGQFTMASLFSGHLEIQSEEVRGLSLSVDEILHRAKKNLATHFDYIGLTEDIERDLPGLERVLGVKISLGRKNVDPAPIERENLSEVERAAIQKYFAPDFELYAFAQQLRRERWVLKT